MKIIVMGAGVVGVTTAYFLAREGHEVTVVEKLPRVAEETSHGNAGLLAPGHAYAWASPKAPGILLRSLWRDDQALRLKLSALPGMASWLWLFLRQCTHERARINTIRKLRLCMYSLEMLHEVVADTGVEYHGVRGGIVYLYRDAASLRAGIEHTAILQEHGLPMEKVEPDRLGQLDPALAGLGERIAGAVHAPIDESGDCRRFTVALAEYCRERLGVEFRLDTEITAIRTEGSRIAGLATRSGELGADHYVMALGFASAFLGRSIGLRLPIYPIKGYSVTVRVRDPERAPTLGGVDEDHLVAYARFGDHMRFTATAEFAGYDRSHRPSDYRTMFKVARDLFPEAADYDHPEYWAGLRPMTPTTVPYLGATRYANLALNTGHGHIGWTMSCGSARVIADLIAGRQPGIDLEGFAFQS